MPFLDLTDPGFDVTAEPVHRAREASWWGRTPYGYAVTRHEESAALLRDRRFRQGNAQWPAQNGVESGMFSDWWQQTLLSLEGDDHKRIRQLLTPAFRSRPIEAMRPRFERLATELVDGFSARGRVEFVHEFAEPYSSRVLCMILGLPETEWARLARWADDLGKSFGINIKADLPRIEAGLNGLYGYVAQLVAARVADPRDDLVTALVRAQQEDGSLTREELGVALVFLVFAGMETTRNQLTLALQSFMRHPDQWALLAEQPELGPRAVEEVMRVNPTVTWITREATCDLDFHGLHLRAGEIVQALSHSAGTDPRVMGADPGFDITVADRPPHTGFGAGVHHCLGHLVARTDMAVALPILARRMPEVAPDGPGEWLPVSGNTGAVRLPLRFRPTPA